jgi:hypothetical protein
MEELAQLGLDSPPSVVCMPLNQMNVPLLEQAPLAYLHVRAHLLDMIIKPHGNTSTFDQLALARHSVFVRDLLPIYGKSVTLQKHQIRSVEQESGITVETQPQDFSIRSQSCNSCLEQLENTDCTEHGQYLVPYGYQLSNIENLAAQIDGRKDFFLTQESIGFAPTATLYFANGYRPRVYDLGFQRIGTTDSLVLAIQFGLFLVWTCLSSCGE